MNQPFTPEELKLGRMVIPDHLDSPLPLELTQVAAHLTGMIASISITQHFSNPFLEPVELNYLFPLSEKAAIVDFSIRIGSRLVRGDLREIEQAREAYQQARQAGQQVALLDQNRPNLFSLRIANVLPKEPIQVIMQIEERLTLRPGELEFVFPMGLTPKYHSPEHTEEAVGVNPPIALPGERIGRVEIDVTGDMGTTCGFPTSPSHLLEVERLDDRRFSLRLKGEHIPDHDFVLTIPLTGGPVEITAWCAQDSSGQNLLVNWLPANPEVQPTSLLPREFVFVLDRSGSMTGEPIRQARNALRACLRILELQDTFRVLLFDDRLEWYQPDAVQVSQSAVDQADTYLNTIEGRGGTEIVQALNAVLDLPANPERTRFIIFLTDGAVSAEERTLDSVRKKLQNARIFTFGIGPSVNRSLLSKMAQLGRGLTEFLMLDEDIEGAILRLQDKVAFPLLTDIRLEWQGCKAWDTYPANLPDLYAGQTLQLVTRIQRQANTPAALRVSGRRGNEWIHVELNIPPVKTDTPEITRAWARARVDDLLEQLAMASKPAHQIRQEVISLAVEHHLVTPFTSFVAVDNTVVNPSEQPFPIAVSLPLPQGLGRGGFFPPPQPLMARMAAAPISGHAVGAKLSREIHDSMAGPESTNMMKNRMAAPNLPPPEAFDINQPAQDEGLSIQENLPGGRQFPAITEWAKDPESALRWLARTQNLDGSWSGGFEFTAAALLAFVRRGHTTRQGHYRKQVSRAADWLMKASPQGSDAFSRALALYELARTDPDQHLSESIVEIINRLVPAGSRFENAVSAVLTRLTPLPTAPGALNNLEDIRTAVALHLHLTPPQAILSADSSGLSLVWTISLI